MKKTQKARKKEVLSLLQKQKIRIIEQIDAYKLSVKSYSTFGAAFKQRLGQNVTSWMRDTTKLEA